VRRKTFAGLPWFIRLQYAVLRTSMTSGVKFGIVFCVGVALCWAATAALRRSAWVRKVI